MEIKFNIGEVELSQSSILCITDDRNDLPSDNVTIDVIVKDRQWQVLKEYIDNKSIVRCHGIHIDIEALVFAENYTRQESVDKGIETIVEGRLILKPHIKKNK